MVFKAKYLKLSLFIFLFTGSFCYANPLKEKFENLDIDLQIRATEDPNFDQYLVEHKKQLKLEQETAKVASRIHQLETKKFKEYRSHYARIEKIRRAKELADQEKYEAQHKKIIKLEEKKDKKLQQEYIVYRNKERQLELKQKEQLFARMNTRLARLPASSLLESRPRAPKSRRFSLYEKILKESKGR